MCVCVHTHVHIKYLFEYICKHSAKNIDLLCHSICLVYIYLNTISIFIYEEKEIILMLE